MTVAALKLYEVIDELLAIGETLEDNGGELTPEITVQLDALEGALPAKVERVALYMRNIEATAVAAENEAVRLSEIAKRKRVVAARLKEYLKANLERAGIPKVETPLILCRIQKNSRPSISCTVPLEQLPEGYVRVTRAFDANVAYALWKGGGAMPAGIVVEVGTHLRLS